MSICCLNGCSVIRLVAVTLVLLIVGQQASAGILWKTTIRGEKLQFELGENPDRVLVATGDERFLVDLKRSAIYQRSGQNWQKLELAPASNQVLRHPIHMRRWGPGPVIAGHRTTFHILQLDELICAEVLVSIWMRSFLEPFAKSLTLLQRILPNLSPSTDDSQCGALPLEIILRKGWPLMIGRLNGIMLKTEKLDFDHQIGEESYRLASDPTLTQQTQ